MKVLVVGANGFLGRHIVQKCLAAGWRTDCLYHRAKDNIPSSCRSFPIQDLEQRDPDYDAVFLAAAAIPYGKLDTPSQHVIDANLKLVLRATDRFKESHMVFASSVSVYGTPQGILNENSCFNRPSYYGLSKIAGEFVVQTQMRHSILRFSSLYGPGMAYKSFLPIAVDSARSKKCITLYGDGSRQQDYLHISDAAALCLHAARLRQNGIHLGVYGRSYSNRDVAKIIQSFVPGCRLEFVGADTAPSFIFDNALTRTALNFEPIVSPDRGIKELLDNG